MNGYGQADRQRRRMRELTWCALAFPLLLITGLGCATVPRESVELSVMVGQRVTAMQESHEKFIAAYFLVCRERIDDFLREQWLPEFMERFVRESTILADLDHPEFLSAEDKARLQQEFLTIGLSGGPEPAVRAVERALGDGERGACMLEFAEAALASYAARRAELMSPLDSLQAEALHATRAAYAELQVMQSTVTAHLQSVHDVSAAEDRILAQLGVLEERDRTLEQVAALSDRVRATLVQVESAERKVEHLRQVLNIEKENR